MPSPAAWNRRQMLQGAGGLAAVSSLSLLTCRASASPAGDRAPRFAFVASGRHEIHVFAIDGVRWTPVQTIPSAQPAALALHPDGHTLYVANAVASWRGLPCGAVEAYSVHPSHGTLARRNQQPLSLSATQPGSLAVSPDGRHLAVAAYGGGIYNLLPILSGGSLGRVSGIVKETGAGPHPVHQQSAHPHTLLFDRSGQALLTTDLGSDRLQLFRAAEAGLERLQQRSVAAGSGPAAMALHPSGHLLFVVHQLRSSLAVYARNPATGVVGALVQSAPITTPSIGIANGALVVHPSGHSLYTSSAGPGGGVAAWRVDARSGVLERMAPAGGDGRSLGALAIDMDGGTLFGLDADRDEVVHLLLDRFSGAPGRARTVASVAAPRSIALLYERS